MSGLLARLGVGGASLDISVGGPCAIQGEPIDTEIVMQGGSISQEVRKLKFTLSARTAGQNRGQKFLIREEDIPTPFPIDPDETREYTMSLHVPDKAPITNLGDTRLRLDGELDLVGARNDTDHIGLEVEPGPALTAILEEFEKLGIVLIDEVVRETPVGSTATERDDWNQVFLFRVSGAPFDDWIQRIAMSISRRSGERKVSLTTGPSDIELDELLYRTTEVGHHRFAIGDDLTSMRRLVEDHVYESLPRNREGGTSASRFV